MRIRRNRLRPMWDLYLCPYRHYLQTLLRALIGPRAWINSIPRELIEIRGIDEDDVLFSLHALEKTIDVLNFLRRSWIIPDGDQCSSVRSLEEFTSKASSLSLDTLHF